MEEVKVCRACLAVDIKMFNSQSFPLFTFLETFVGVKPYTTKRLPPYICFECAAMIRKTYFFHEKCLVGQSILCSVLETNGMVTKETISQINRDTLNLISNLRSQLITEDSIINVIHEGVNLENSEVTKTGSTRRRNSKLKVEDIAFIDSNDECKTEAQDNDTEIKIEFCKAESDGFDDFISGAPSTDDDEPLSLQKVKKDKKSKSKKRNKKERRKKIDKGTVVAQTQIDDEKPDNNLLEILMSEESSLALDSLSHEIAENEISTDKRKRGRPSNKKKAEESRVKYPRRTKNTGGVIIDDDCHLEEYVTVIRLTEKEQMEEVRQRQFSSNYQNAAFQCNLCYKGFIDTHAWRHHVGKHDPSAGDVECPVCKFRFKTKRALQKHAGNHEKKYACKSCTYVSKTTTQAKQHQRWHKGVTYKCQYCNEVSNKWTSYLSHVRIKHPSQYICGACGYSFVSQLGLNMHRTMMHKGESSERAGTKVDEESGPYCEQCDVKFLSEEAYKRHMVTSVKHAEDKAFKTGCKVCGESFTSAEELRLHHRKEHAKQRPRNYGKKSNNTTWPIQCQHCPEVIPNAREYWTHFRRVHPDKSYPIQKDHVCDICGKAFRGNAFLVYHKRTHFEERAYKCQQCPKAFFNRTNLQMHEKTHSDNRPYPCNVCFKAFKCKGALDRHYRSHTGVKPYECEFCGKAFGQSNSRKLHVRTVHLKQPAPYVSKTRIDRRKQQAPEGLPLFSL